MRVQSWMRGRQGGKYHVRKNNCHDFVDELTRRICILKKIDSDSSSMESSEWGSTVTLPTGLDEKAHEQVTEVSPTPVHEKELLL